ncbi:MAG: vitamin K epoxide reductase family protein [bacterium]|nr:vitamin K epoxide reductase family protein [bacterium]
MKYSHLTLIILGSLLGLIASIYLSFIAAGTVDTAFCSIGETFDCGAVNSSKYARLFGFPNSWLGILAYTFLLISALINHKNVRIWLMNLSIFGVVIMLLFGLYLTYIEAFVLYAWCIFCVMSLCGSILAAVGLFSANREFQVTIDGQ